MARVRKKLASAEVSVQDQGAREPAASGWRGPPLDSMGRKFIRYTKVQTEEQIVVVEAALVQGLSERDIKRALEAKAVKEQKPFLAVSLGRIRKLKARVHEQMKLESERTRPQTKEKQLRRLYTELADARKASAWQAVTKIEDLIARIEGNYEPIRLDVDVVHREALTNVLTSITPEQAAAFSDAYDQMMQLAESAARATGKALPSLLPAPEKRATTVFTVEAESVSAAE